MTLPKGIYRLNRRYFIYTAILAIIAVAVMTMPAKSRTKSYNYGDAVNFQGRLIIGTTNTGEGEIFELINGHLTRQSHFKAIWDRYSRNDEFFDIAFKIEQGRLYAYLVDGRRLYKYDVTDTANPKLVRSEPDNSWDWKMGVGVVGDKVFTTGPSMVKVWTSGLVIVDSFKLKSLRQGNISFSPGGDYIFQVEGDRLSVFDTNTRQVVADKEIVATSDHNRVIYNDPTTSSIYLVDGEALKKIDISGHVQDIFYHTSDNGYDVAGIPGRSYVYFSDGIGVVKARMSDLEPIDWAYTTGIAVPNGWAIGLKAVADGAGDRVVVFNNSSILVLDENLGLIDFYRSVAEETGPQEMLALTLDKDRAAPGSMVAVTGQGFGENEELVINFAGAKTAAKADNKGRFMKIISVPDVNKTPVVADIKVTGESTGLTYSISFNIE